MALIVQKFGGSSVKDRDHLFRVAHIIDDTRRAGNDVVVVVSAQGDTTDELLAKVAEITCNPSPRELDMLLSTGEQSTIALLTMALHAMGCPAVSLTGWQAGFWTDQAYTKARITRMDGARLSRELARNRVVVVAGFQGLNEQGDITTLGRGGSDTSAVAIAAALHADHCQIYTDVEGIYTADPRKVPRARKLKEISVDEMLELATMGSQVLNSRSVELTKKYNVELEVLSSLHPEKGTVVKETAQAMEEIPIKGVTKNLHISVITLLNLPDAPDTCFQVFRLLAENDISVDMILQSPGRQEHADLRFTVAAADEAQAVKLLRENAACYGGTGAVKVDPSCAKVSIVGAGVQAHSGVAVKLFEALSRCNISVKMITTSEIKVSVILHKRDADLAVRAIHDSFIEE